MLTVGLTGGIASGKSLVAKTFEDLGVPVLDADVVAREVVAPPSPALAEIARRFGRDCLLPDGSLDRRRLREQVFADPQARKRLEQITHPLIRARLLAWRDAQTAPYCMLVIPLLVEGGAEGLSAFVDRILVVDAPVETQIARLLARDGINETLAQQMIASQARREQRLARADDVIANNGGTDAIPPLVRRLHERYLDLVRHGTPRAPGLHLPES